MSEYRTNELGPEEAKELWGNVGIFPKIKSIGEGEVSVIAYESDDVDVEVVDLHLVSYIPMDTQRDTRPGFNVKGDWDTIMEAFGLGYLTVGSKQILRCPGGSVKVTFSFFDGEITKATLGRIRLVQDFERTRAEQGISAAFGA